jgi:hypothetical protein
MLLEGYITAAKQFNMNINKQLREILQYYATNRQVGHTTATLQGANNSKCILVAWDEHSYDRLMSLQRKRKKGIKYNAISLMGIQNGGLRGYKQPIVFDNGALYDLFLRANRRITELEDKIERIKAITSYC